jgi:hypothetical protein
MEPIDFCVLVDDASGQWPFWCVTPPVIPTIGLEETMNDLARKSIALGLKRYSRPARLIQDALKRVKDFEAE